MKKIITVLLLSAMICQVLGACQTRSENPNDNDKKTHEECTVKSADTGSNPEDVTEYVGSEQDIAPMPLDIETIGGVVIVGKIGFDEKGWHIVPEQPLNITYTYFLDNPSVFSSKRTSAWWIPRMTEWINRYIWGKRLQCKESSVLCEMISIRCICFLIQLLSVKP